MMRRLTVLFRSTMMANLCSEGSELIREGHETFAKAQKEMLAKIDKAQANVVICCLLDKCLRGDDPQQQSHISLTLEEVKASLPCTKLMLPPPPNFSAIKAVVQERLKALGLETIKIISNNGWLLTVDVAGM